MVQMNVDESLAELVDRLAGLTGETRSEALLAAVRERLSRQRVRLAATGHGISETVDADQKMARIVQRFSALPVLDGRTADEIMGYDENGLPGW